MEHALLELLAERELGQISVADLTRRADVNRSTFYEHYTSVDDLAARACTAMFDELIAATPVISPHQAPPPDAVTSDALAGVFAHVAEHAHLYQALLGDDGSANVINYLHRRISVAVHVNLTVPDSGTHADDPAEVPRDTAAAFLAGALLGTVMDWLRHDCPGTPEQVGAAIWPHLLAVASATGYAAQAGPGEARVP
ncbi:TetR/AcrR family transcriptional regulator [Microtetraspora sp. AC03309]|nr:TetR/AcrR family transcriptional regulator [Microtetraspora sp. AC03309]